MSEIVKTKVLDSSILESRFESLLRIQDWMTRVLSTLKNVLAFARFLRFKQCLYDNLIHRDVSRLSAFGFGDDYPVTAKVYLPPLQVKNFASPHSGVQS